jgi:hypothetical protein
MSLEIDSRPAGRRAPAFAIAAGAPFLPIDMVIPPERAS